MSQSPKSICETSEKALANAEAKIDRYREGFDKLSQVFLDSAMHQGLGLYMIAEEALKGIKARMEG